MGLDMTVSLGGENLKENEENSFYYRLNWSGVSYENSFMFGIAQHILGLTKKVSKRDIKKRGVYLVTGQESDWFNGTYNSTHVVYGKSIRNVNHKNMIKIRSGFRPNFISVYKIYEINPEHSLPSAVSLVGLNAWHGSNGEVYFLEKEDNGDILFKTVEYIPVEDAAENEPDYREEEQLISTLDEAAQRKFLTLLKQTISTLENLKNLHSDHPNYNEYIVENNLTILKMMLRFFEDQAVETFTVSYG